MHSHCKQEYCFKTDTVVPEVHVRKLHQVLRSTHNAHFCSITTTYQTARTTTALHKLSWKTQVLLQCRHCCSDINCHCKQEQCFKADRVVAVYVHELHQVLHSTHNAHFCLITTIYQTVKTTTTLDKLSL